MAVSLIANEEINFSSDFGPTKTRYYILLVDQVLLRLFSLKSVGNSEHQNSDRLILVSIRSGRVLTLPSQPSALSLGWDFSLSMTLKFPKFT